MDEGRTRITQLQKQRILDIMQESHLYLHGRFPSSKGAIDKEVKWVKIASDLNKLGPSKTVAQWKRCWTHIKANVKKKVVKRRKHNNKSGLEPSSIKLTENDQKVISICKEIHIDGNQDLEEIGIQLPNGRNQSALSEEREEFNQHVKILTNENKESGNHSYEKPLTKTKDSTVTKTLGVNHCINYSKDAFLCDKEGHLTASRKPHIISMETLPRISVAKNHTVTKQDVIESIQRSPPNGNNSLSGRCVNSQHERENQRFPQAAIGIAINYTIAKQQSCDEHSNSAYRKEQNDYEDLNVRGCITTQGFRSPSDSSTPRNFEQRSTPERIQGSPNQESNSLYGPYDVNNHQQVNNYDGATECDNILTEQIHSPTFNRIQYSKYGPSSYYQQCQASICNVSSSSLSSTKQNTYQQQINDVASSSEHFQESDDLQDNVLEFSPQRSSEKPSNSRAIPLSGNHISDDQLGISNKNNASVSAVKNGAAKHNYMALEEGRGNTESQNYINCASPTEEDVSEEPRRRKTRRQFQRRRPQKPLANLAKESIDLQKRGVDQNDTIIEQNRRLIRVTENLLAENMKLAYMLRRNSQ